MYPDGARSGGQCVRESKLNKHLMNPDDNVNMFDILVKYQMDFLEEAKVKQRWGFCLKAYYLF